MFEACLGLSEIDTTITFGAERYLPRGLTALGMTGDRPKTDIGEAVSSLTTEYRR